MTEAKLTAEQGNLVFHLDHGSQAIGAVQCRCSVLEGSEELQRLLEVIADIVRGPA